MQQTPIKTISLIISFLLVGMAIGYNIAPLKTYVETKTKTKTIEKSKTVVTETATSTIQLHQTLTTTMSGSTTTITFTQNTTHTTTSTTTVSKEWITILEIEGENNTITNDFNISATSWKIKFTVEGKENMFFGIFVFKSGEETVYTEMILQQRAGTQARIIKAGPGSYYLNIRASNVKYHLEVQVEK